MACGLEDDGVMVVPMVMSLSVGYWYCSYSVFLPHQFT